MADETPVKDDPAPKEAPKKEAPKEEPPAEEEATVKVLNPGEEEEVEARNGEPYKGVSPDWMR